MLNDADSSDAPGLLSSSAMGGYALFSAGPARHNSTVVGIVPSIRPTRPSPRSGNFEYLPNGWVRRRATSSGGEPTRRPSPH